MAKISGVLKNGFGEIMAGYTLSFLAQRNTQASVRGTVSEVTTDASGNYSKTLGFGKYQVSIYKDGTEKRIVGEIFVYRNSPDGTLEDFLSGPGEDNVGPEYLRETIYWSQLGRDNVEVAEKSAAAAKASQVAAKTSETNAKTSETNAKTSETNAKTSETNSASSASSALDSKTAAKLSETNAKTSETNAKKSEDSSLLNANTANAASNSALQSKSDAAASAAAALAYRDEAKASEANAAEWAQSAEVADSSASGSAAAALASQNAAKISEDNAKTSETSAKDWEQKAAYAQADAVEAAKTTAADKEASEAARDKALEYRDNAFSSETSASRFASNASGSASAALSSQTAAKLSETNANTYKNDAQTAAGKASNYMAKANSSAAAAATSELNAANQTGLAFRFGGTVKLPEIGGTIADAEGKFIGIVGGKPAMVSVGAGDSSVNLALKLAGINGGKEIGITDPVTKQPSNIEDMILSRVAPGVILDSATTSWAGINTAQEDMETDNWQILQDLVSTKRYITIDSIVNLTKRITMTLENQVISGISPKCVIRPIADNMAYDVMFKAEGKFARFRGLTFTNPNMYKGWDKFGNGQQRQGSIDLSADFCIVDSCIFWNQLNAVVASIRASAHGSKVINNYFLDCLGVGSGPDPDNNPYPNSNAGEDRGDACTLWGSGSLIANNYANAKEGEDARVAFHFENTGAGIINPRPYDASNNLMIGNVAMGPFRRHFVMENITNGMAIGNTSLGGATWWNEAIIQCTNVKFENTLHYTRTTELSGNNWNPPRGASASVNYNENVEFASHAIMEEGSIGSGFVIKDVLKDHDLTNRMQIINKGDENNVGIYLTGSVKRGVFNELKLRGFSRGVAIGVTSADKPSNLSFNNCDVEGNGTADLVTNINSLQGTDINFNGGKWLGGKSSFIAVSDAGDLHLSNVIIDAGTYAVNVFRVKNEFTIKNCVANKGKRLSIRNNGATSGNFPNSHIDFSGNTGIIHNFVNTTTQITDSTAAINANSKYPGKQVTATITFEGKQAIEVFVASGSSPESVWFNLTNHTTIGNITPVAPAAPETPTEPTTPTA